MTANGFKNSVPTDRGKSSDAIAIDDIGPLIRSETLFQNHKVRILFYELKMKSHHIYGFETITN